MTASKKKKNSRDKKNWPKRKSNLSLRAKYNVLIIIIHKGIQSYKRTVTKLYKGIHSHKRAVKKLNIIDHDFYFEDANYHQGERGYWELKMYTACAQPQPIMTCKKPKMIMESMGHYKRRAYGKRKIILLPMTIKHPSCGGGWEIYTSCNISPPPFLFLRSTYNPIVFLQMVNQEHDFPSPPMIFLSFWTKYIFIMSNQTYEFLFHGAAHKSKSAFNKIVFSRGFNLACVNSLLLPSKVH